MDRVVIDTEGRVYEPLGHGDDQIGHGSHRYHKSRFGQDLGLLPEIVKSVAALKLLQPAPLCVQIDGELFTGIGSIWAATGVGP